MRPEKQAIINEIRARLEGRSYVILADCRGLTAEQMKELRGRLKEAQAGLMVVKNSLFGLAVRELGWDGIERFLQGPTAMIAGSGDITSLCKILKEYTKANNLPVVKGGRLGGLVLSPNDVEALASVPSREVLLGQLVGTLAAPLQQLVGVMSRKISSLAVVLNAIAEKKTGVK